MRDEDDEDGVQTAPCAPVVEMRPHINVHMHSHTVQRPLTYHPDSQSEITAMSL